MICDYEKFTSRQFLAMSGRAFLYSFGWYFVIFPVALIHSASVVIAKYFSLSVNHTFVCGISIVQFLFFLFFLKDEIKECLDKERYELRLKSNELQKEKIRLEKEHAARLTCLKEQETILDQKWCKEKSRMDKEHASRLAYLKEQETILDKEWRKEKSRMEKEHAVRLAKLKAQETSLRSLINSKTPFKDSAAMQANVESLVFAQSSKYLMQKKRPAPSAAEEVANMRKLFQKTLRHSKEIQYKYEYILSAFPEIAEYAENDEDLITVAEYHSYSELDELKDRRKDYLSDDEYNGLSENEKSQLALDRYVGNRNKSKWQIGRDYEMCCAFRLIQDGYFVELHGVKYGKNDLGRDLIAIKQIGGLFGHEVLIVQCKNWSSAHEIHENVIMQLFGTAIEYQLSDEKFTNKEIVPVLMIPNYTKVSEKAISFAKKLHVRIERVPFTEFPRIKCNINNGCKIYHLPFDQQYDRTEIKLAGECYAYTVAEAVSLGFRRAKRHLFDSA